MAVREEIDLTKDEKPSVIHVAATPAPADSHASGYYQPGSAGGGGGAAASGVTGAGASTATRSFVQSAAPMSQGDAALILRERDRVFTKGYTGAVPQTVFRQFCSIAAQRLAKYPAKRAAFIEGVKAVRLSRPHASQRAGFRVCTAGPHINLRSSVPAAVPSCTFWALSQ